MLTLTTALGLPRQVAAFSASVILGFEKGLIIATLATTLGCTITFITCRYLFADYVLKRFPEKSLTVHNFLSTNTFAKALTIRLLPLGSNFITNIVAGATSIPFKPYIMGSFIGYLPQMILFTLAGNGLVLATQHKSIYTLATCGAIAILVYYLWYKHKKAQHKLG